MIGCSNLTTLRRHCFQKGLGSCLDFLGAVLPNLLPLSHGDPMQFHKKITIPPMGTVKE